MITVTVLGTTAGAPTKERGHPGMVISYQGNVLLFDCGENAQVQLLHSGVRFMRIDNVFITHFHGDHFFGLPGFLFSMSLAERTDPVTLFGPRGAATEFERVITLGHQRLNFEARAQEITAPGTVLATERFRVEAAPVEHSRTPALAYAFVEEDRIKIDRAKVEALGLVNAPLLSRLQAGESVECNGRTIHPEDVADRTVPGRRIVYSGDTRPCAAVRELARGADLLVHEATYAASGADHAKEYGHSTTVEAAELARDAGVKKLVLTHISKRYEDAEELCAEAREVFPATVIARDLMSLEV